MQAIHQLADFVSRGWRQKDAAGAIFLDVAGAFSSVIIRALVRDLRAKGIPKTYTDWLKVKLKGQHMTIKFDDHESAAYGDILICIVQ